MELRRPPAAPLPMTRTLTSCSSPPRSVSPAPTAAVTSKRRYADSVATRSTSEAGQRSGGRPRRGSMMEGEMGKFVRVISEPQALVCSVFRPWRPVGGVPKRASTVGNFCHSSLKMIWNVSFFSSLFPKISYYNLFDTHGVSKHISRGGMARVCSTGNSEIRYQY